MMENLTIGYEFVFNIDVLKRNGKAYKGSSVVGLGITYSSAVWDIYLKLKKKRSKILKINKVRVFRNAFAVKDGSLITVALVDFPPNIPEDLNKAIEFLPKDK
jgi:hypothetical protein